MLCVSFRNCDFITSYTWLKFWLEFQKSGNIQCTCVHILQCAYPMYMYSAIVHEVITPGAYCIKLLTGENSGYFLPEFFPVCKSMAEPC